MIDQETAYDPAQLAALPKQEVAEFLRRRIHEKRLAPLVRRLNEEVLSGDPARRATAELALRRIGFL